MIEKSPTAEWGLAVALTGTGLAFGAVQLVAFPSVSTTGITGIEVVTEGLFVPLLVVGLFLITSFDLDREVSRGLCMGTFVLLLHAVTETADELVTPPLPFTVVFEHVGLVVGMGMVFGAIWREGRVQRARESELKQTRDLLERTEDLADVGGWELDVATDDLHWTEGTCRIHDLPPEYEPTLEEAISFYHEDDRSRVVELVENCRENGEPYDAELRLVTADDRIRWVRVRGEADAEDDSVVRLRGAIRDITAEKKREQQLTVYNRIIRHNLRNSLSVIMGWAEQVEGTLQRIGSRTEGGPRVADGDGKVSVDQDTVDQLRDQVRLILDRSENLARIGEKIRQYHDLTVNEESVEPVPLRPLLERVRTTQQNGTGGTIRVRCPSDVTVLGTPVFLKAALGELVHNGVEKAEVDDPTVVVTARRSADRRVTIRLRDPRREIPEHERVILKGENESPLEHGSGFGLWIARWLVDQQDGEISVEDGEDPGTVIAVSLPATPDRETRVPGTSDSSKVPKSR